MGSSNLACCLLLAILCTGCYAPLHSPGIPACTLPDSFRVPQKFLSTPVNFAALTAETGEIYQLRSGDLVRVDIAELESDPRRLPPVDDTFRRDAPPFASSVEVEVTEGGEVFLPLVGMVSVDGMTLEEARTEIAKAYSRGGFIDAPRINVAVIAEGTTKVIVLGAVTRPEVYELARSESSIAHALARAGGLTEEAGNEIQVHRRSGAEEISNGPQPVDVTGELLISSESPTNLRIPLRSLDPVMLDPEQARLEDGDVVVVQQKTDEIFFVVGELSTNNLVRFTLGRENRDLGNGFVLPPDRDVDVVTAVAMAGYIDPIDSPTTVTVHRTLVDGTPMLIHVDLIAARFDRLENIMVQAGDIIYLNPDAQWWFRRTLDRVIPTLLTSPYTEAMERWINPNNFN